MTDRAPETLPATDTSVLTALMGSAIVGFFPGAFASIFGLVGLLIGSHMTMIVCAAFFGITSAIVVMRAAHEVASFAAFAIACMALMCAAMFSAAAGLLWLGDVAIAGYAVTAACLAAATHFPSRYAPVPAIFAGIAAMAMCVTNGNRNLYVVGMFFLVASMFGGFRRSAR